MGRPQYMLDMAKVLDEAVESDLADLRDEIKREEAEFHDMWLSHHRYMRALKILDACIAARLGLPTAFPEDVSRCLVETLREHDEPIEQAAADAQTASVDVLLDKPAESEPPQAQPEQPQAKPADVTELPASGEILLDDSEPAVEEDDRRSIEERIRDLLAKVGNRSDRQIGAQIGVEKSVVYAALHGSRWFRMERGNNELPEHNRPWQLTAAGER